MTQKIRKILVTVCAFTLMCMFVLSTGTIAQASGLEDDVTTSSEDSISLNGGEVSQDDQDVANWIKNQRGMTGEQLEKASNTLSPLTNLCGYLVGGIVCIIFTLVFVITVLDILYITVPPIRGLLYKGNQSGGSAQVGGYNSGYNSGYTPFNQGMQQGGQQGLLQSMQWISDEAVQCAMLSGGGQQQAQAGGYPGQQAPQQGQMSNKSIIAMYFKKRVFFMILLGICVLVLTSSALLGTSINLAQWLLKIIDMINGNIPV